MDRIIAKRFVFIALLVCLASCSSDPKLMAQQEKFLDSQIEFYEDEAQDWRASGHEGMGDYFEQKSLDSRSKRTKRSDLNYGLFDILIDIIFD